MINDFLIKYCWVGGCISRKQLFFRIITTIFILLCFIMLLFEIFKGKHSNVETILFVSISLIGQWVVLCSYAQRLHDIGRSGWWILLFAIPGINLLFIIFLFVLPGKDLSTSKGTLQDKEYL